MCIPLFLLVYWVDFFFCFCFLFCVVPEMADFSTALTDCYLPSVPQCKWITTFKFWPSATFIFPQLPSANAKITETGSYFVFECFHTLCLVHCPLETVHIDVRFNVFAVLAVYTEEWSLLGRYAVLTGKKLSKLQGITVPSKFE